MAGAADLIRVYEVSFFDVPTWWFPLVGVAMLLAGPIFEPISHKLTFSVWPRRRSQSRFVALNKLGGCFPYAFIMIWIGGTSAVTYWRYQDSVGRLERGDYEVVEGTIAITETREDRKGKLTDAITIEGVELIVSERYGNGYSNVSSDDGLLKNGVYARLAYIPEQGTILRIEMQP